MKKPETKIPKNVPENMMWIFACEDEPYDDDEQYIEGLVESNTFDISKKDKK